MKSIILALASLFIVSCNFNTNKDQSIAVATDTISNDGKADAASSIAVYEGTLPCADCEGIVTILKIDASSNKFQLSSIYKGKKPEKSFEEKGNINTERGLEKDPDGTIFILNWDKPEKDQIYYGYYSKNPEKLYLLDRNKRIIQSNLNYFLELNE